MIIDFRKLRKGENTIQISVATEIQAYEEVLEARKGNIRISIEEIANGEDRVLRVIGHFIFAVEDDLKQEEWNDIARNNACRIAYEETVQFIGFLMEASGHNEISLPSYETLVERS